jgi:ADP-ribose pyrophosphatase YjhB (NUDIX family)
MTPPRIRVAALLVREGRVLLVEHEKAGRRYHLLPGGGVDPGEPMGEALRRELREETGLEIAVGELLLASDAIPPDGGRHIVNLVFRAEVTGGRLVQGNDPRMVGVAWHPVAALAALPIFPDYGPTLLEFVGSPEGTGARYLGNLWRP